MTYETIHLQLTPRPSLVLASILDQYHVNIESIQALDLLANFE